MIKPMMKPIKKPKPNPKNPIVSIEYIEIIKFFMVKFAKNDHWPGKPGKGTEGGNSGATI